MNFSLIRKWSNGYYLKTPYERRQALIENDVLSAMSLGLSLEQLILLYHIQFSVLRLYEDNTWYDSNGEIIFTINRSLGNIGVSRKEWENICKENVQIYSKKYIDTTISDPIEKEKTYIAPYTKCNREEDYRLAWEFFEKKYGGKQ